MNTKRYFQVVSLAITLLIVAASCKSSGQQQTVTNLDPKAFSEKMKASGIQLVDVRTPQEVAQGKIGDAQHIDFFDPSFKDNISKLDHEKPVMVYCAVGGRSSKAAQMLADLGFKEIYNLSGGINAWNASGMPVKK